LRLGREIWSGAGRPALSHNHIQSGIRSHEPETIVNAAGIDRIVMLVCGTRNLREVALFPMNQQANDLLMGAAAEATPKQMKELHLRISPLDKKTQN
jgi:aspartyl-tRNA synthetase